MENSSQSKHCRELFREKKCCVIIPTYNNAQFLDEVVTDVLQYCPDVVVVNDGSTDHTLEVLSRFSTIEVLSYPKNRGKGHALKTGFRYAWDKGYRYAVTIDSDGQHYAKDLQVFLDMVDENPNAIIIGARDLDQENMNGKSNFANKFSNFWFKVETGLDMPDTQSGYRLYPLHALHGIRFFTSKYEFEIEVLVRSAWKGVQITSAPIDVYYPVKEERVSHFRPFKDFFRISILNTMLVLLAFFWYHPRKMFDGYRKKSLKEIYREIIDSAAAIPNHKIALSIALGVFMGIFPIWGYQLLVGFVVAHLLSLHKGIFFIAANISLPPLIPFIIYLSYVTGSFMLGKGSWHVDMDLSILSVKGNLKQYIVGAVTLSFIASVIFGVLSYLILMIVKRK
ncbi:MAG: DUF2062 domain-containing protein [Breznakibacter sp.]